MTEMFDTCPSNVVAACHMQLFSTLSVGIATEQWNRLCYLTLINLSLDSHKWLLSTKLPRGVLIDDSSDIFSSWVLFQHLSTVLGFIPPQLNVFSLQAVVLVQMNIFVAT